jgi:hypothetical protein
VYVCVICITALFQEEGCVEDQGNPEGTMVMGDNQTTPLPEPTEKPAEQELPQDIPAENAHSPLRFHIALLIQNLPLLKNKLKQIQGAGSSWKRVTAR